MSTVTEYRSNNVISVPHPLQRGIAPAWASGWGEDKFGPFVEIQVDSQSTGLSVVQRLRWIAPGDFWIGSPDDEPGRFDREGPRHRVKLTQGYWLFDTPVTQGFWEAVMGENPSYFVSENRPVERVSYEDVERFLSTVNSRYVGLGLSLPSEAQWEYACRAGSEQATYAGPIEILGDNNAPVLSDIAWYGGNSSENFELENGYDSSDWPEREIQGGKAGTHPVGTKRANQWGLYDMLGNVLEWCSDGMRGYQENEEKDPVGDYKGSRVVRGGSWSYDARFVRAAVRVQGEPGSRDDSLGFRCLRVQGRE